MSYTTFSVGAAMFLEYGNESIQFKYKPIELYNPDVIRRFAELFQKATQKYAIPVILLDKGTPKETVCQLLEDVSTGEVLFGF